MRVPVLHIFVLLVAAAVAGPCLSTAADRQPGDELALFLQDVQDASDTVTSFHCRFTQEKRLVMFDRPVIFEGELVVVRPDKLRWEFTAPVPSVLMFNGSSGVRCSDRAEPVRFQLADDPVMSAVADQLRIWLGGNYRGLEPHYTLVKQEPATLVVTPKRAAESEYIASIRIVFDDKSLQPYRVEIAEPGGDLTSIVFQGLAINSSFPDRLFNECAGDD